MENATLVHSGRVRTQICEPVLELVSAPLLNVEGIRSENCHVLLRTGNRTI